jgi:hypothetical protein
MTHPQTGGYACSTTLTSLSVSVRHLAAKRGRTNAALSAMEGRRKGPCGARG